MTLAMLKNSTFGVISTIGTVLLSVSASAQSYGFQPQTVATNTQPDVYVVMFRADYCAPCRVVEPRLATALNQLSDPAIEYIELDTGGGHGEWNSNVVFDRGIVKQYNKWLGITGFAAIVDGDTKQTLGCVNMDYDAGSMARHIRNLQQQARANQVSFDLTCPAANNPISG